MLLFSGDFWLVLSFPSDPLLSANRSEGAKFIWIAGKTGRIQRSLLFCKVKINNEGSKRKGNTKTFSTQNFGDLFDCPAILQEIGTFPSKRGERPKTKGLFSGKEKVPQRTCATKILPNFWLNFLVRFASKPLFYWVVPSNCSEKSLVLFVHFFGFGVLFGPQCFVWFICR